MTRCAKSFLADLVCRNTNNSSNVRQSKSRSSNDSSNTDSSVTSSEGVTHSDVMPTLQ